MKHILPFCLSLILFACGEQPAKEPTEASHEAPTDTVAIEDNMELKELHDNDQNDRKGNIDWSVVGPRDSARRVRVYEMIDQGMVQTASDYYHAAMVFQHGGDSVSYGMAVKLMRQAVEMDTAMSKWLLAAAIDRDLLSRDKPQIYGTQYLRMNGEDWVISDIDTTQITDEERRAFGVRTRAEQRATVRKMNQKKLFDMYLRGATIAEVIAFIQGDENDAYDVSEDGINTLGYSLMAEEKMEEALQVFKLNTEMFSEGFNTWDSYGECLMAMGQKEEGIAAYKKSLELNPANDNAEKIISDNK